MEIGPQMGHERMSGPLKTLSALPFKAGLEDRPAIGRFVPKAATAAAVTVWASLLSAERRLVK
jgi:hypothetical protein